MSRNIFNGFIVKYIQKILHSLPEWQHAVPSDWPGPPRCIDFLPLLPLFFLLLSLELDVL